MKVRRAVWLVLPVWLVPLVVVGVYLDVAPNVVTRTADAGAFVSAQIQSPDIFADTSTSVQTTHGLLFVAGVFTAPTGESLVLRDSTEDGVQLCRKDSDACADLVGRYIGDIPAVPGVRTWLTYSVRQDLQLASLYWFLFGLAWTAYAAVAEPDPSGAAR